MNSCLHSGWCEYNFINDNSKHNLLSSSRFHLLTSQPIIVLAIFLASFNDKYLKPLAVLSSSDLNLFFGLFKSNFLKKSSSPIIALYNVDITWFSFSIVISKLMMMMMMMMMMMIDNGSSGDDDDW